jgi:hypothetical protein
VVWAGLKLKEFVLTPQFGQAQSNPHSIHMACVLGVSAANSLTVLVKT